MHHDNIDSIVFAEMGGVWTSIELPLSTCSSDLSKPASTLYLHNLTGILETAIRATNAQYDSSEALKRLDVRLLDLSPGDQGWDVFSLHYHVDGPIGTVSAAPVTPPPVSRVLLLCCRCSQVRPC